jgi:hypothetical protein
MSSSLQDRPICCVAVKQRDVPDSDTWKVAFMDQRAPGTQPDQLLVIVDVEEGLSGAFGGLTGQVRYKVVAVEMDQSQPT